MSDGGFQDQSPDGPPEDDLEQSFEENVIEFYPEYEDPEPEEGPPQGKVLSFPSVETPLLARGSPYEGIGDDELDSLPDPQWLVEPFILEGSLAMLYGESGVGKSFLAQELALGLASGRATLGKVKVRRPVAYIAAEGIGGCRKRVAAWKQDRGYEGKAGVTFFKEAFDLRNPGVVSDLIRALLALPERPWLVVVDTMARCTPGADENSVKDLGAFVALLDQVRLRTGCAILIVHHSGYNKAHPRGSTVVYAATDTVISLEKRTTSLAMVCKKQKDFEEFLPFQFALRVIILPDELTSCVIQAQGSAALGPLSTSELQLLQVLVQGFPAEEVPVADWAAAAGLPPSTFSKYRKKLLETGFVAQISGGITDSRYVATDLGFEMGVATENEVVEG